jgi:hypothetical protein
MGISVRHKRYKLQSKLLLNIKDVFLLITCYSICIMHILKMCHVCVHFLCTCCYICLSFTFVCLCIAVWGDLYFGVTGWFISTNDIQFTHPPHGNRWGCIGLLISDCDSFVTQKTVRMFFWCGTISLLVLIKCKSNHILYHTVLIRAAI